MGGPGSRMLEKRTLRRILEKDNGREYFHEGTKKDMQ
jgi:hypothetical protein